VQRLHQNVSFRVFAAADDPFAPDDVTRLTGLTPTDVRLRDLQRERPRNVSWWEFSPSSSGDINENIEELSRSLHSAAAGLTDICGLQESEMQLPIETGRQAVEIRIRAGLIDLLQVLGTEIDCDLYWPRKQQFIDGTCVHCGLSEMCSIAELRWSIGGQLHAAEWQARYSLSAPPPHAISKFSPDAPEYWPRLDRNLEAAYFESPDILQFSSDYWPCSGSIAEISAESHLSNFLDVLERYVGPLIGDARASSRVTISLLERGDFQGSAGLHFDKRSLERIHRLGASLCLRLSSIPVPNVQADGTCFHCDKRLLGDGQSDRHF